MQEKRTFNGINFYYRVDNGYWYSTTNVNGKRVYMHKYVWSYYNGEIPKGYEIHHIDLDRNNNNIENLQLISNKDHRLLHAEINKQNYETVKKWRGNLEKAKEKAKEWHSSPEGIEWHKEHAKKHNFGKFNYGERICLYCGNKYEAHRKDQKYCCNNCRSYATQKRIRAKKKGII